MKLHIVIAMYNMEQNIERNVRMLQAQTYRNFCVILIDDMSTDNSVEVARRAIGGDERFRLVVNQEKKFKTRNVVDGIAMASADDEDVIALIDGDDCLASENALQIVVDTYERDGCWMTYGSYEGPDGTRDSICVPYKDWVVRRNAYRKVRWLASHLKTFKFKLWNRLDDDIFRITADEIRRMRLRALLRLRVRAWWNWRGIDVKDLHDSTGRYIRRVDDKAFTYAMLEMSGPRVSFIEDILYVYNYEGPDYSVSHNYGADKSEKWHTRLVREILRYREPYPRLDSL